eukprot:6746007-Pyramimonas_sp.AAC.1
MNISQRDIKPSPQAPNERNYHIFYQLCAGASEKERAEWGLQTPSRPPPDPLQTADCFHYVSQNDEIPELEGVDDVEEFAKVRSEESEESEANADCFHYVSQSNGV